MLPHFMASVTFLKSDHLVGAYQRYVYQDAVAVENLMALKLWRTFNNP